MFSNYPSVIQVVNLEATACRRIALGDVRLQGAVECSDSQMRFFLFAFAGWTLACHTAVLVHASFASLAQFGPLVSLITGLVGAWVTRVPEVKHEDALESGTDRVPDYLTAGVGVGSAAIATALFAISRSYEIGWLAVMIATALALTVNKQCRLSMVGHAGNVPVLQDQIVLLWLSMAVSVIASILAIRPDADDAFFVGVAAHAVANPELPVLSSDPIYGKAGIPLLLSAYRVESIDLLAGAVAYYTGLTPIFALHVGLPLCAGVALPTAWAILLRLLLPRSWGLATFCVVLLLAFMGEMHRGIGNFAFVRLFQGKAIAATILLPLLLAATWNFMRHPRVREWMLLTASAVAAIGSTSSALFLAPLVVFLGVVSAASASVGSLWQHANVSILAMLPMLYPISLGLDFSSDVRERTAVLGTVGASAASVVKDVFGPTGQFIVVFGAVAACFLAPTAFGRRAIAILTLGFFGLIVNPWIFSVFPGQLVPVDVVWRCAWAFPAPMLPIVAIMGASSLVAIGNAGSLFRRPIQFVVPLAATLTLCAIAWHGRTFRSDNWVSVGLGLKVPAVEYAVAEEVSRLAGTDKILLAPEEISVWVSTQVRRPMLELSRELYDLMLAAFFSPQEAARKPLLRALAEGSVTDPIKLNEALAAARQGLVFVIVTRLPDSAEVTAAMNRAGYALALSATRWTIWRSEANGRNVAP